MLLCDGLKTNYELLKFFRKQNLGFPRSILMRAYIWILVEHTLCLITAFFFPTGMRARIVNFQLLIMEELLLCSYWYYQIATRMVFVDIALCCYWEASVNSLISVELFYVYVEFVMYPILCTCLLMEEIFTYLYWWFSVLFSFYYLHQSFPPRRNRIKAIGWSVPYKHIRKVLHIVKIRKLRFKFLIIMLIFAMNKLFLWSVQKIDVNQNFCTLL